MHCTVSTSYASCSSHVDHHTVNPISNYISTNYSCIGAKATLYHAEENTRGIQEFCSYQDRLKHNKHKYNDLTPEAKQIQVQKVLNDSRAPEMIAVDLAAKLGLEL